MSDATYGSDPRAKTNEGFIAALQILSKYTKNGEKQSYMLDAEHDEIFATTVDSKPSKRSTDGKLLDALGWHYDKENECWAYFT